VDDVSTLIARIAALLDAPGDGDDADVCAHMETTLTDGYARALALEAEHWRLQREIGAIAANLAEGGVEPRTQELTALARRLAASEAELESLRDVLTLLKNRLAQAARVA